MIIGVDYHLSFQQIAFFIAETGECGERRLSHDNGEAERFYRDLKQRCMGRTEADPMITSEPLSSMERLTKTNKTTLQSEWTSALKKDLTGPTLLEISGNATNQGLTTNFVQPA